MQRVSLIICLFLWLTTCDAAPVAVTRLQVIPLASSARLLFAMSTTASGTIKYTTNPSQVTIEFTSAEQKFTLPPTAFPQGLIRSIAVETTTTGIRYQLAVRERVTWQVRFHEQANQQEMQIDFLPVRAVSSVAGVMQNSILRGIEKLVTVASKNVDQLDTDSQQRAMSASLKSTQRPHRYIIVVDAGHGGKDPGAKGAHGQLEKNLVLSIAKKLVKQLNAHATMRAVLTRDNDTYLPLRARLKYARKENADLFVAIHADAYFDNAATGVSVFAVSKRGATSEAARWLAQQENYSELGGVELGALKDRSPLLRSVLIDLAQTTTIRDSLYLGNQVLDALDQIATLHHAHVEQAPFVVLKSPDIPSILVETGFITNPREERRLASDQYQNKIAEAIAKGIERYVNQNARLENG